MIKTKPEQQYLLLYTVYFFLRSQFPITLLVIGFTKFPGKLQTYTSAFPFTVIIKINVAKINFLPPTLGIEDIRDYYTGDLRFVNQF